MTLRARSVPQAQLSVFDAVTIMVGLVVGIGIFRAPSIVAGSVDTGTLPGRACSMPWETT